VRFQIRHKRAGVRTQHLWFLRLFSPTRNVVGGQMGGAGFIHYNNTVEEQVEQAVRAKRHVPGCLFQPPTLSPSHTLRDYDNLVVRFPSCLGSCFSLRLSVRLTMFGSVLCTAGVETCVAGEYLEWVWMPAWHMRLPVDSCEKSYADMQRVSMSRRRIFCVLLRGK
jgi:hypothetical protein